MVNFLFPYIFSVYDYITLTHNANISGWLPQSEVAQ